MKKLILSFASLCLVLSVYSCRETENKADDAATEAEQVMEETPEVIEEATEAVEEATDSIQDAVEEAIEPETEN